METPTRAAMTVNPAAGLSQTQGRDESMTQLAPRGNGIGAHLTTIRSRLLAESERVLIEFLRAFNVPKLTFNVQPAQLPVLSTDGQAFKPGSNETKVVTSGRLRTP